MKTWVKLYTEINRDPDMGTLTWAQRGIWQALLALCGEIDDRDENEKETGRLDILERVAWSIRCEIDELAEAIAAFEDRGMITTIDGGCLYLPNYQKRQARPPSARPSAVSERVKRHRAKLQDESNEDVTTLHRGVTPSDPDTDPDTEKTTEGAGAPDNGPATFADWQELIRTSKNRPADLVAMHERLYPGRDPPDFGYMGKIARQVGGAGRMAELLWQHSTRPPTGDVLAYVLAVAKGDKKRGATGNGDKVVLQGGYVPHAADPSEFYDDDG